MRFPPVSRSLVHAAAIAAISVFLAACDSQSSPSAAAATPDPAPVPATAAAPAAVAVSMTDSCASAFSQLQQCHRKLAASGQASANQLERSATYLRRLQAWWDMDRNNPAILNSCQAISAGGLECEPEPSGDEAESAEEFKALMQQFDAAGVPK